jgi:hypothetical protein
MIHPYNGRNTLLFYQMIHRVISNIRHQVWTDGTPSRNALCDVLIIPIVFHCSRYNLINVAPLYAFGR